MSLNVADIRIRSRIVSRNAGDPAYYTNAEHDEAIDRLCARFLRVTRCVKLKASVNLNAGDNEADFSSLAGFMAERIERVRLDRDSNYTDVRDDLDLIDARSILNYLNDPGCVPGDLRCGPSGTPRAMGFTDSTTATFYPEPSDDGTLTVVYSPLQTPWTLGTAGDWSSSVNYALGDVVSSGGNLYRSLIPNNLNNAVGTADDWENLGSGTLVAPANIVSVIPDGLLVELIGTGIAPMLQAVDPEHQAFVGAAWQSYLAFEQSCIGIGSIGGKSSR